MHAFIHTYTHTYVRTYIQIYIYTYIHTCRSLSSSKTTFTASPRTPALLAPAPMYGVHNSRAFVATQLQLQLGAPKGVPLA